nr:carboxypeptidase Y [Colletotrichum truncatum]KAF6782666.1 carboxypeptidase Y [Colletotrichum truncatum]
MAGLFAVTVWFQLLALIAASTKILTWEDQKLLQAGDAGHAKSNCPKNRVIRQNNTFCDAGSTLWTGTIEIGTEDRNMFFMYFESLNESETDPLIIWLNGGPGASSMAGAFYEIGPCLVNSEINTTSRNLLSWTAVANMIFVDQPIGVGFSRSDDPALWANNLAEAAIDFERFLSGLFDLFPHLDDGKREFHLAGESFAGHYIPHFISAMRWNLSSVILVDPYIDSAESALGMVGRSNNFSQ